MTRDEKGVRQAQLAAKGLQAFHDDVMDMTDHLPRELDQVRFQVTLSAQEWRILAAALRTGVTALKAMEMLLRDCEEEPL